MGKVCSIVSLVLFLFLCIPGESAEIETLEGVKINRTVTAITEDGSVFFADDGKPQELQRIWRINTDTTFNEPPPNSPELFLVGGGHFYADEIHVRPEAINVSLWGGENTPLDLRYVRGLLFPRSKGQDTPSLQRFYKTLDSDLDKDRVIVRADDKIVSVSCIFDSLNSKELTVKYKGQTRTISRNRVIGIVLAKTVQPPDRTGHCRIELSDGSTIWGEIQRKKNNIVSVAIFPDQTLEIPWGNIAHITVNSRNMTFASDLDPVSIDQKAIVTYPWKYQRDHNVMGGTLSLGNVTCNKGLGVHAESHLTYKLNDAYTKFVVTIGLDSDRGKHGDCIFRVDGDGEKLYEQRVRGSDQPRTISINIAEYDTITLAVTAGNDLDIGDNANWCNARFIK